MPCQDFQFFDTRRLEELREIEMRNFERRKAIYDRRYAPDEEKEELEKDAQRILPVRSTDCIPIVD